MKKYKVTISRTDFGYIGVEAETEKEASLKALDLEMEGNVYWLNSDCEACAIEEVQE